MGELSAEAVTKLLCTLPGIEQGIIAVVQTLATLATESADREARMKRKIGELAAEMKDLKQELVSLKNSAIALMKAKTTNNSSPAPAVQADVQRTHSSTSSTRASKRSAKQAAAGRVQSDAYRLSSTDVMPSSESRCDNIESSCEPPRIKQTRVRRGVIWIGNLRPAISIEQLEPFIQQRALTANQQLTIFSSKLISKADGKVGARVTISRASVEALTQPNFWPRPVYARPWVFRDDQRNAADKKQQEQQQKTQENQHQESTLSLEQRNTADQQQQQKKRQEEHQKTQENQHQESTPEEHQHLQTEQQNLHTASSDSQCPASNDSQCPASSDSQCPAANDSQSPASSDVQQDSGQHQPKLQDTSTTSAPAKATPPRPGKRHAEDSPGSMSGIPCKMQPSSSCQ
ncbi:TPR-containing protein DDB_G0280363-like [Sycon ciliatum]|uniref:TPR-containing protein DDB_G0280363-like n=1 Tax=Sycon ciliatum TaxID=27933 RepID=UPI0031F614EC